MFWKKWACYVSLVGCLFLLSGFNPLWAAEADISRLIELLKSKNILTEQEADQLLKEVKESAKIEQKEKEEMKTAATGAAVPSALKGFQFSTTIYSEWQNRVVENDSNLNQFNVNRAYLTFKKDINDWLGMNVTTDVFTSKDADDKGNGLEVRLKFAYANLKFLGTNTELGLVHTPSDDYDGSIWPYRVQGKHLFDDLGIQPTADFGIYNKGEFKWGGYMIGVYNGPGFNESEANNNKVVSGTVYLRPLPSVPLLKGLQIAYTGSYGESNTKFDPAKVPGALATEFPDFNANIAQVSLQDKLFTIMGQYYWGESTAMAAENFDRKAYQVEGFVRVPGVEKARVFGRYQYFDPNTDKDNDTSEKVVAGLSYDMAKEFMPFIAYENKTFDTTTAGKDYYQTQIGFQLKF